MRGTPPGTLRAPGRVYLTAGWRASAGTWIRWGSRNFARSWCQGMSPAPRLVRSRSFHLLPAARSCCCPPFSVSGCGICFVPRGMSTWVICRSGFIPKVRRRSGTRLPTTSIRIRCRFVVLSGRPVNSLFLTGPGVTPDGGVTHRSRPPSPFPAVLPPASQARNRPAHMLRRVSGRVDKTLVAG